MNIVLIGYRGSGKSTIAEIVAKETGFRLMNLDAMIVEKAGIKIPEIVEKHGWEHFRDMETAVLEEAASGDNQVLDCGGGIIMREENRQVLKKAGPVFWLTAPVNVLAERIRHDDQRPSLTGKSFVEEIEEVMKERLPLYRDSADHRVDTDQESAQECAKLIISIAGYK